MKAVEKPWKMWCTSPGILHWKACGLYLQVLDSSWCFLNFSTFAGNSVRKTTFVLSDMVRCCVYVQMEGHWKSVTSLPEYPGIWKDVENTV